MKVLAFIRVTIMHTLLKGSFFGINIETYAPTCIFEIQNEGIVSIC